MQQGAHWARARVGAGQLRTPPAAVHGAGGAPLLSPADTSLCADPRMSGVLQAALQWRNALVTKCCLQTPRALRALPEVSACKHNAVGAVVSSATLLYL